MHSEEFPELTAALVAWVEASPVWPAPAPVALPAGDVDQETPETDLGYAEGQTFMIEYRDSLGEFSRRRITVRSTAQGQDGVPLLVSWCYEREAVRSFRSDRILSCIDYDGVVHSDVRQFLSDNLGIRWNGSTRSPTAKKLWMKVRDGVRPDAVILAAVARCDGRTVVSEVQEAVAHLASADGSDVLDESGMQSLTGYFKRLRPTGNSIASALSEAGEFAIERRKRLVIAAAKIMDADGRRHGNEMHLVRILARELLGATLH